MVGWGPRREKGPRKVANGAGKTVAIQEQDEEDGKDVSQKIGVEAVDKKGKYNH